MNDRRIDDFRDRAQQPAVLYVDVFPFYLGPEGVEFLALNRRTDVPLPGVWQPVCGKLKANESIQAAFSRQVFDKTGQRPSRLFSLDRVTTFYDSYYDAVLMVPAAAAELRSRELTLDPQLHVSARWVGLDEAIRLFEFDGQIAAVRTIAAAQASGFSKHLELKVHDGS